MNNEFTRTGIGQSFALLVVALACAFVFSVFALGVSFSALLLVVGMALLYLPVMFFVPSGLLFLERFVLLHLFGLTYAALFFVLDVLLGVRLTLLLFIVVALIGFCAGLFVRVRGMIT